MNDRLSSEKKQDYHRELLDGYKDRWGEPAFKVVEAVHQSVGVCQSQTDRAIRMLMVKSYKIAGPVRISQDSLSRLMEKPGHRIYPSISDHAFRAKNAFSVEQYCTDSENAIIFRLENNTLGNIYAAFLLGESVKDVAYLTSFLVPQRRSVSVTVSDWQDIPRFEEEVISADFARLPDGSPYKSGIVL